MHPTHYYSVRMHASVCSRHLSGAERLVTGGGIDSAVDEVLSRAFSKHLDPHRVSIMIDDLGPVAPRRLAALDVTPLRVENADQGKQIAFRILLQAGVSEAASHQTIDLIGRGAAISGGNMRGAMIVDLTTGDRLEPDKDRGVRSTRFDWNDDARPSLQNMLQERGLAHFRTREALALATKIAHGLGVQAELCWSDDPDYCAGYVASIRTGYVRIPVLKQSGDDKGGRAIFIDRQTCNLDDLIAYLEREPVLVSEPRLIRPETDGEEFLRILSSLCSNVNLHS
jgi:6-carboxyhexanoate--CoA ligase